MALSTLERAENIVEQYEGKEYSHDTMMTILCGLENTLAIGHENLVISQGAVNQKVLVLDGLDIEEDVLLELSLDESDIITQIQVFEKVLQRVTSYMICPMCESGELVYNPLENKESVQGDGYTHIYVCNECPMVAMEWYDSSDTKAFNKKF